MRNMMTLVIMQLKEKLNLRGRKFHGKTVLSSVIFGILKFALIVALCFGILFLCKFLQLFSLIDVIPISVITVVFVVMLLISIVAATLSLTKGMYYSYDNPVLLTLPCLPTQVYFSKLIVFYIYELIRNMSFMVPMFLAYGIISGYSLFYYLWVFICFIFISMIPVLIGSILSIPTMWFYNFFRQYKRLQLFSLIAIIAVITFGVVKTIDLIPENIDLIGTWGTTFWEIQDFLKEFVADFNIFHKLVLMVAGIKKNFIGVFFTSIHFTTFLFMLLLLISLLAIGLVVVKPLFYKMASKPFEYRKEKVKAKENKVMHKRLSTFKTEFLLNVREPEKLFVNIGFLISMPVLIFFLNKIFAAMNTRMLGNTMTIAFNILIILLIALTSNCYAASVFSRDGRSSYLIKVQPTQYQPLLISKLVFNTLFMLGAFTATFFVLLNNTALGFTNSLILILSTVSIYFAHLFYSAELDVMNPQTELYATIGNSDSNPNETKSTVIAFLGSFVTFGMFLFLLVENPNLITYLKLLVIAVALMLFRLYMLLNKIKLYYMER